MNLFQTLEPKIRCSEDVVRAEKLLTQFLRPTVTKFRLLRIGGNEDGAYLIPDDLHGVSACFSPGVGAYKPFEDELALRWGIKSHLVDFSADLGNLKTPLIPGMQTFQKLWLGAESGASTITLQDWLESAEESESEDLLLQMDIEGAEYSIFKSTKLDVLRRFRVLVVEFHDLRSQIFRFGMRSEIIDVVRKLSDDFVVVHVHPNNADKPKKMRLAGALIPNILEVTMIRRDRLGEDGLLHRKIPSRLPNPLDIPRNVVRLPPVFLGRPWVSVSGRLVSTPTRLAHLCDYLLTWVGPQLQETFSRVIKKLLDPLYVRWSTKVLLFRTGKNHPGGRA